MNIQSERLRIIPDREFKSGPIRHQIDSANHFYITGINQICTSTFEIKINVLNVRSATEEDLSINKVAVNVVVNSTRLDKPTYTLRTGQTTIMTPSIAREYDLTYSSPLYINATITAQAYKKDGTVVQKVEEVKDLHIGAIPTMVRSQFCHTYGASPAALREFKEDPTDPGGYFIIKGIEWVIDNLENIKYNWFHAYPNNHKNEVARGELISKPGDAFENSSEIIIKLLNNNQLVCRVISQQFQKEGEHIEFPFFTIFRILGCESDKEMMSHIVFGDSEIDTKIKNILSSAMTCNYPVIPEASKTYDMMENILMVSKHLDATVEQYNEYKEIVGDEETRLNKQQHVVGIVLRAFDRYFLPHVGLNPSTRHKKIRYFGFLINHLLMVYLRVLPASDRDSYGNKRIHPAGVSYSKTFKTQYNFTIVQGIRKLITDEIKNTQFSNIQWASTIKRVGGIEFERALTQAITSSDSQIRVNTRVFANHLVAQQLHRNNQLNILSTLRQITTPSSSISSSKSSRRADLMRRVHWAQTGYVCMLQSADTGPRVGMLKQMAISASITPASTSAILKSRILADEEVIPIDSTTPEIIHTHKLAKIMVNGEWIGLTNDSASFWRKYRDYRRTGAIDRYTTIHWDFIMDNVYLWVDVGRIVRPLLIVYNTHDTPKVKHGGAKKNTQHHTSSSKFEQYLTITNEYLDKLYSGEMSVMDLVIAGVVEYISAEEQQNLYIAESYDLLMQNKNNELCVYSHCEIPQAVLGVAALTSPLLGHNQLTRVCYQTNQVKQTCSSPAKNWRCRFDKNTFLQYYNEMPLVSTMANNYISPAGSNVIVALMCYGGYNQEDSLIFNQASVKRGLFTGSSFNFERTELDRNESFGVPNQGETSDIKANANYSKLGPDGFIKIGTIITNNDVIIGKKMEVTNATNGAPKYIDRSIVYQSVEDAIVENVLSGINSSGVKMCKVVFRSVRPLTVGDKFCLTRAHHVLVYRGHLEWVPIYEVAVGMSVPSLNLTSLVVEYKKVIGMHIYYGECDIYNIGGYLECTEDHRIIACRDYSNYRDQLLRGEDVNAELLLWEYVLARNIKYEILILTETINGKKPVLVSNITRTRVKTTVYCPEVQDNNNFLTCFGDNKSWTGNSSRAGQKGVCGMVYPQSDMPYTDSGLIPDIIMNPHSIPSRMTMGMIIEMLSARLCAIRGFGMDGTAFQQFDIYEIGDMLEKLGFDRHSEEVMYNGFTGRKMDCKIFIAPTYYQRLQKFVVDTMYAISTGPTCAITRQPVGGKAAHGGLRMGEMERDVTVGNGAVNFLNEKFFEHSDGFHIYICKNCGSRDNTIVNEQQGKYKCLSCAELANIVKVPSSWSAKLFMQELRGMNVGMKWTIKPPTFEEYQ